MGMQMSDHGRGLLTQWEGFKTQVYDDGVGVATIGVGHALTGTEKTSGMLMIDGTQVPYVHGLTAIQVQGLLATDLHAYENAINEAVEVAVNQNQFDALVAFCFNIGINGFHGSSALKDLNNNVLNEVPDDMRKWNKAGGVFNQGLANRRENEIKLWLGQI
jgi:lysozyme